MLVVDGGGSMRCALVGDMLAALGRDNGWARIVVNGCLRDSAALDTSAASVSRSSAPTHDQAAKLGAGEVDVLVTFGEATFAPGVPAPHGRGRRHRLTEQRWIFRPLAVWFCGAPARVAVRAVSAEPADGLNVNQPLVRSP